MLIASVHALDDELGRHGGRLVIRSGDPADALRALVTETGATDLYFNADVSPYADRRDSHVRARLNNQLEIHTSYGNLIQEPGAVLTKKGGLSQVFSAFHRTWVNTPLPMLPEPGKGRPVASVGSEALPAAEPSRLAAGTDAAYERLQIWNEQVDDYETSRNLIGDTTTSRLSVDLKFGTLGPRTILAQIGTHTPGRAAFIRQVAWRDWWAHLMVYHPDISRSAIRPAYDRIAWEQDDDGFERWATGTTGFPLVDAGMRQLVATGWMHGRLRMICASFLVKDLLIDWRRGERFFRHHLLDADPPQNAGNWQWVAGTGPDAAPYFRIFNPVTQSKKFDKDGDFIRAWVPELAKLPSPAIHEPATLAPLDLVALDVVLGRDYPAPIVDHANARQRTLIAYRAALDDGELA